MLVCKNNATDEYEDEDRIRLEFMTQPNGAWIRDSAKRFEAFKNGAVEIVIADVPFASLNAEIINEAVGRTAVFDGFITPPTIAGSIVEYDGWADLTSYIQESASHTADWSDILIGYRQHVATYQGKPIMFPLDGDLLSLYYRKDVLEHFNLTVPRTWDEYDAVVKATHGEVYENQTLAGYVPYEQAMKTLNLNFSDITFP